MTIWDRFGLFAASQDSALRIAVRVADDRLCLLEQRDRTDLQELRDTKAAIRSAIEARVALGLPVPATGVGWGRQWELHTRPVPDDLPGDFD